MRNFLFLFLSFLETVCEKNSHSLLNDGQSTLSIDHIERVKFADSPGLRNMALAGENDGYAWELPHIKKKLKKSPTLINEA